MKEGGGIEGEGGLRWDMRCAVCGVEESPRPVLCIFSLFLNIQFYKFI